MVWSSGSALESVAEVGAEGVRMMAEQRPVIISCDGHATGRPEDYVPYVEPAYRGEYENFVRELKAIKTKSKKRIKGRR